EGGRGRRRPPWSGPRCSRAPGAPRAPTSRSQRFLRDPLAHDLLHTVRTYVPHCQIRRDLREPPPTMDSTAIASLSSLWDRVFGTQPDPDMWVVVAPLV